MGRRVTGAIAAVPEIAAQARVLLAQGLSKRAIALRLGVSEATLYRCLRASAEAGPGKGLQTWERPLTDGYTRGKGAEPSCELPWNAGGALRAGWDGEDDGYPEALLRRVPCDFVPILPRRLYLALLRAAERAGTPAATESLRQALLLHAEPMIPPPTSIELVLSAAEEAELNAMTFEH